MASKKTRLLIVEDNEQAATPLKKLLAMKEPEWEVDIAPNGVEAVAATKRKKYDLALLDLTLPGMRGEEVLQTWAESGTDIRMVIFTGDTYDGSFIVRCARLGACDFLQKGLDPLNLIIILKKNLLIGSSLKETGERTALVVENNTLRSRVEELDTEAAKHRTRGVLYRLGCALLFVLTLYLLKSPGVALDASVVAVAVPFFIMLLLPQDKIDSVWTSVFGVKMKKEK